MSQSDEGVPVRGAKIVCVADKRVPVFGEKDVRKDRGVISAFSFTVFYKKAIIVFFQRKGKKTGND